jgi:hypothetical protein
MSAGSARGCRRLSDSCEPDCATARQQILAQAAGARRSGGAAFAAGEHDTAREMAKNLLQRAHKNTVIVALANKLARIVWAGLGHSGTYDPTAMAVA